MTTNAQCNICGDCIKSCPNDSIRLTLRPPTQELWFIRKPKLEEAFLAIVIMGIVFIQNITMLEVWQSTLRGLENLTGTKSYAVNFTITFLIAMLIPHHLVGRDRSASEKLNGDSLAQNFAKFGYAIIPLRRGGACGT